MKTTSLLCATLALFISMDPEPAQASPPWMQHHAQTLTLHNGDGTPMRVLYFPAHGGKPRAVLICLHGIQTHADWFTLMAPTLQDEGITVLCPDRRGSGPGRDPQRP